MGILLKTITQSSTKRPTSRSVTKPHRSRQSDPSSTATTASSQDTWEEPACTLMIATLAHEVGDDPVEGGALEPEALLPGAEGAEVLRGLGHHVSAQLHDDLAHRGTVGGDVEEDPNGGHCAEDGLDPSAH